MSAQCVACKAQTFRRDGAEASESELSSELWSTSATLAEALDFPELSLVSLDFEAVSPALAFSRLSLRQSATSCPSMSQCVQCCFDRSALGFSAWSPFDLAFCLPFRASFRALTNKAVASEPDRPMRRLPRCSSSMLYDLGFDVRGSEGVGVA